MKKRILSTALALALCLSLLPSTAMAAGENDVNGDGYHDGDVEFINGLIDNNGLDWEKDDIASWSGITWNGENPNRISFLSVANTGIFGRLDVSSLTELMSLECQKTGIKELDVSSNEKLMSLHCWKTDIEDLDVSNNSDLIMLHCNDTNISELNVANNEALMNLECGGTGIMELDITNNTKLTSLLCSATDIAALDVSKNTALKSLECNYTPLFTFTVPAGYKVGDSNVGDEPLNYAIPGPARDNYTFSGWYTAPTGGEKVEVGDTFDEVTTLYAHWESGGSSNTPNTPDTPNVPEVTTYTVTFNSNGGSDVAVQYVNEGEKLTKPADPTKSGNTFGGWYKDKVITDTYTLEVDTNDIFNDVYKWNFDTDVVMGDFTLHAKWTEIVNNPSDDSQNNNNDNGYIGGGDGYSGPVSIPGKDKNEEKPKDENKPTPAPSTPSTSFSDVPAGAYYADAVKWAVEKGITNGVGGGLFAPNTSCTRGQMVTFLWRVTGCPTISGGANFGDVAAGSYYADAIAWAVEKGITNGTGNGRFSPDAECSRAQMAVFLFRMVGGSAAGGASFGDVDANAYYADAVAWAAANGITTGTGNGNFSPNANCTRGQMVTFLYRCFAE